MRRATPLAFAVMLLLPIWAVHAAPAPAAKSEPKPRPTQEEIQKTFDAGDYAQVLQQVSRVLPLKGDEAAGYDRYQLLMLKGEAHLRQKQLKFAADAFGLAARETKEPNEAATARALKRTLQEAKGVTVQRKLAPKNPDVPSTADVTDPKAREAALQIVYAELLAASEGKLKEARRARTLPPFADAFTVLAEIEDFEKATAGSTVSGATGVQSAQEMREQLGERAGTLIDKELARLEKDVEEIHDAANTVVKQRTSAPTSITGVTEDVTTTNVFRGLSDNDRRELRGIIDTCRKIIPTAEALADASGGSPKEAEKRVDRAKDIERSASRALAKQYNTVTELQRGGRTSRARDR